jgi:CRISPR system Cascade subunit CasC
LRIGWPIEQEDETMFVELHLIQHFAPSNLNRDDTGAPKDCEFGGVRRARISSQCIKRAIRTSFQRQHLLSDDRRAVRTKRLLGELADRLVTRGKDREEALAVAQRLIESLGLAFGGSQTDKTQYLLFVARQEIEQLVDLADREWETLRQIADPTAEQARDRKKQASRAVPSHLARAARDALDGSKAVDLALFGRMLADLPERNIDAACQVAHAISTNRVTMEFDYYTAVDDLLPEETTGADMIGTVEFNSACYYRYQNVDIDQLVANLQNDAELARAGLEAFLRSSVLAVPTGKQNSFAAQNPPSLVFAVVREHGLWSLANAFVEPARPRDGRDLVQESVRKLDAYWGRLSAMYGTQGIRGGWVATYEPDQLTALLAPPCARVATVHEVIQHTVAAAFGDGRAEQPEV